MRSKFLVTVCGALALAPPAVWAQTPRSPEQIFSELKREVDGGTPVAGLRFSLEASSKGGPCVSQVKMNLAAMGTLSWAELERARAAGNFGVFVVSFFGKGSSGKTLIERANEREAVRVASLANELIQACKAGAGAASIARQ